jgi:1-deoxy-D-xylulose-5-phosphate reductoisomerase
MIGVVILGSTGSIGRQALEVMAAHPDRFRVVGVASGHHAGDLLQQAVDWPAARAWL